MIKEIVTSVVIVLVTYMFFIIVRWYVFFQAILKKTFWNNLILGENYGKILILSGMGFTNLK